MTIPAPLTPNQVYRRCDPDTLDFDTTADLPDSSDFIGQERAEQAIDFGVAIDRFGFNMFAMGAAGSGRRTLVKRHLRGTADSRARPDDWVYVFNFDEPHRPKALSLKPGDASRFRRECEELIEDLRAALPAAFESDEYRAQVQSIEADMNAHQEQAIKALAKVAEDSGLIMTRTQQGIAFVPVADGKPMEPDAFRALPEDERERLEKAMADMQESMRDTQRQSRKWEREQRDVARKLNQTTVEQAVAPIFDELAELFDGQPGVIGHLEAMKADVVEHAMPLLQLLTTEQHGPPNPEAAAAAGGMQPNPNLLKRYQVNVMIENAGDTAGANGAPVIECDFPTHGNLMGRIEHVAQFGTLTTDHTLIKPGDLHKANGGYLLLDVIKLVSQPFAWQELKRALHAGEIPIEQPNAAASVMYTQSLQPIPIKLDVKVVLFGDRYIYNLLKANDPEFAELFKVAVDFAESMDRTEATEDAFGQTVGQLARRHDLKSLTCAAAARMVEHASRLAAHQGKLSTHMRSILDVVQEADFLAAKAGRDQIEREDVTGAIDAMIYRLDRPREMIQERIGEGTMMIDVTGTHIGQVNGLAVLDVGGFAFGKPNRISARVRPGKGEVVDIERQVELGGPLHTKGVMILSGYLGARFAADTPLALSATLVFEQSYGPVDGDSASSTELYALLSALSGVPIDQGIAVTGSVNQFGEVQAIGGANEKIEGFFDSCLEQGELTGSQGVMIPASNVKHLMLRHDVVEAIEAGTFRVWPIETIDQGIEVLTGVPAGEAGNDGAYPADSINGKVAARLAAFAEVARKFGRGSGGES